MTYNITNNRKRCVLKTSLYFNVSKDANKNGSILTPNTAGKPIAKYQYLKYIRKKLETEQNEKKLNNLKYKLPRMSTIMTAYIFKIIKFEKFKRSNY